MKDWITSVVVTVVLASILSLILPDGKTGKSVKSVLAFITLYVFIAPLLSLENMDLSFNFFENNQEIVLQTKYLDSVFDKRNAYYQDYIKNELNNSGVINAEVKILYDYNDNFEYCPKKVELNLQNSVIKPNLTHIDIIEKTKQIFHGLTSKKIDFEVIIYE